MPYMIAVSLEMSDEPQTLYFLQIYCLQLVVTLNMDTWLIIYQNMKKRRSSKIGQ